MDTKKDAHLVAHLFLYVLSAQGGVPATAPQGCSAKDGGESSFVSN